MKNTLQKILIVDDDLDMCFLLNHFLSRKGYTVIETYSGEGALKYLKTDQPDLVLCDLNLNDTDGITLLNTIRKFHRDMPVIIITAYSDLETANRAQQQGAFKYILKPLQPEDTLLVVQQALTQKKKPLKEGKNIVPLSAKNYYNTKPFKYIIKQVNLVAPSDYTVIIYGKKGTGKKTIAYEIHSRSRRSNKFFLAIDAISFSEKLESNAMAANGGTIFITQVEKLSTESQLLLLRLIKEKKIKNKNSFADIDIRIICASGSSLWDEVRNAGFNEELYNALNDFNIFIPSLCDCKDDIIPFALHFLHITNTRLNKNIKGFTPEVESFFKNYYWHSNLLELKNMIHTASLLTTTDTIGLNTLSINPYTNLLPQSLIQDHVSTLTTQVRVQ